jgi:hypothetical protein
VPKPKVFVSYSQKDRAWLERLGTHLAVLAGEDLLDPWDDRRIDAGGD